MSIKFFTAISYGGIEKSYCQTAVELIDNFFYFGGKKAVVINGHTKGRKLGVILKDVEKPSWLETTIKILFLLSFAGLLTVLIFKCVLRSINRFYIIAPEDEGYRLHPIHNQRHLIGQVWFTNTTR